MIKSSTPSSVEGATLAVALNPHDALLIAGGEIVQSVTLPRWRCMPFCTELCFCDAHLNIFKNMLCLLRILLKVQTSHKKLCDTQPKALASFTSAQRGGLFPPLWLVEFDAKLCALCVTIKS